MLCRIAKYIHFTMQWNGLVNFTFGNDRESQIGNFVKEVVKKIIGRLVYVFSISTWFQQRAFHFKSIHNVTDLIFFYSRIFTGRHSVLCKPFISRHSSTSLLLFPLLPLLFSFFLSFFRLHFFPFPFYFFVLVPLFLTSYFFQFPCKSSTPLFLCVDLPFLLIYFQLSVFCHSDTGLNENIARIFHFL